jgi:energy-converting hydrogenase Eha subunit E
MQFKSAADAVSHGQLLVVWALASLLAAQYPWALMLMVVLQSFLTAILLRAMLRRRARERLLGHI